MNKEFTSEQLAAAIDHILRTRCTGIDPSRPNLRFCPKLESCDGPGLSARFRFRTYDWMADPEGAVHSGIISTIFDNAMGILCDAINDGIIPTITLTVSYCHPVPLNADVLVRVQASYPSDISIHASAEMCLPENPGTPLATTIATYYIG